MYIQKNLYEQICRILQVDYSKITDSTNKKINKAVTVLHCDYLIDSAREARAIINKKTVVDKFELLISIYDKRIRQHQILMLLLNLCEVALKSKASTVISNKFSSPNTDDWFWVTHPPRREHQKIKNIVNGAMAKVNATVTPINSTFELFNYLMIGDLQKIYKICWASDFGSYFQNSNYYSNSIIPFAQHSDFHSRFERIRKYRNNIYHGNPGGASWQSIVSDIEDILVQLEYNFHDAINQIDPNHKIVKLKYSYPRQTRVEQCPVDQFYKTIKDIALSCIRKLIKKLDSFRNWVEMVR